LIFPVNTVNTVKTVNEICLQPTSGVA
jgi:hypothetical protein